MSINHVHPGLDDPFGVCTLFLNEFVQDRAVRNTLHQLFWDMGATRAQYLKAVTRLRLPVSATERDLVRSYALQWQAYGNQLQQVLARWLETMIAAEKAVPVPVQLASPPAAAAVSSESLRPAKLSHKPAAPSPLHEVKWARRGEQKKREPILTRPEAAGTKTGRRAPPAPPPGVADWVYSSFVYYWRALTSNWFGSESGQRAQAEVARANATLTDALVGASRGDPVATTQLPTLRSALERGKQLLAELDASAATVSTPAPTTAAAPVTLGEQQASLMATADDQKRILQMLEKQAEMIQELGRKVAELQTRCSAPDHDKLVREILSKTSVPASTPLAPCRPPTVSECLRYCNAPPASLLMDDVTFDPSSTSSSGFPQRMASDNEFRQKAWTASINMDILAYLQPVVLAVATLGRLVRLPQDVLRLWERRTAKTYVTRLTRNRPLSPRDRELLEAQVPGLLTAMKAAWAERDPYIRSAWTAVFQTLAAAFAFRQLYETNAMQTAVEMVRQSPGMAAFVAAPTLVHVFAQLVMEAISKSGRELSLPLWNLLRHSFSELIELAQQGAYICITAEAVHTGEEPDARQVTFCTLYGLKQTLSLLSEVGSRVLNPAERSKWLSTMLRRVDVRDVSSLAEAVASLLPLAPESITAAQGTARSRSWRDDDEDEDKWRTVLIQCTASIH